MPRRRPFSCRCPQHYPQLVRVGPEGPDDAPRHLVAVVEPFPASHLSVGGAMRRLLDIAQPRMEHRAQQVDDVHDVAAARLRLDDRLIVGRHSR